MELWFAALGGLIAGGALLAGAAVGWFVDIPQRVVAAVMAVGAGVLISTLAFELVQEATADGGLVSAAAGFALGAILYVAADAYISRPRPARATLPRPANAAARRAAASGGSGGAIAAGSLIDGIPEAIVMGLSVVGGTGLSIPIVAAVAISNVPEGLGSTSALKASGSSARHVFALWGSIAVITVIAACTGYLAFQTAPPELTALVTTIAAGALLAMVCSTMIPEAFEKQHALTGLWATAGFLAAFVLHEAS